MMPKKKDNNLDFDPDLSELGGAKKVIQKSPRIDKPEPIESKKRDIVLLSIPQKKGQSQFISKTIKECSGSEFVKWANSVCHSLPMDEMYYNKEINRKKAFREIIRTAERDYARANPKTVKTLH